MLKISHEFQNTTSALTHRGGGGGAGVKQEYFLHDANRMRFELSVPRLMARVVDLLMNMKNVHKDHLTGIFLLQG